MLGHTPILPPDPATYLDGVRGALRAPIVFGNLEGTLTDASGSKCATPKPSPTRTPSLSPGHSPSPSPSPRRLCYAFRVPPSYASDLAKAGFTVLNNANNHSYDFGAAGQQQTVDSLDAAHIAHTGLPGQITVVRAKRIRVAFVGFAPYGFTASLLDLSGARALIRAADRRAGVVVVYMHAGAEGSGAVHVTGFEEHFAGEDRGNPRAFAHAAVDAGADLVIASGPHVLRGMEFYRGRLIAYSLGNFAGYHNFSDGGDLSLSAILRVTLAKDGSFGGGRLVSLRLSPEGRPGPDPSHAALELVASLSRADFGRRAARFWPSGIIRRPGR
ncbi:MAG: CapA family protein [Deltaproteobacteria bacterium]|nr:MAG: CapA family protein [Deltaproteobacteria bacterium]